MNESRKSTKGYVCPACSGREWAETAYVYSRAGEEYILLRCEACGAGRVDWDPRPAELGAIYGHAYYSQNVSATPSIRTRVKSYLGGLDVGIAVRCH